MSFELTPIQESRDEEKPSEVPDLQKLSVSPVGHAKNDKSAAKRSDNNLLEGLLGLGIESDSGSNEPISGLHEFFD